MINKLGHCAGVRRFPCWYGHTPHPLPPNSHMSFLPRDRDHLPKSHYLQPPGTRCTLTLKNTVVLEDVGEPWAIWSITLGRLLMTNSYMGEILLCRHWAGSRLRFHKQFSSVRVRKGALFLVATNQYTAFSGDIIPPVLSAIAIYTRREGRGGSCSPGSVLKGILTLKGDLKFS